MNSYRPLNYRQTGKQLRIKKGFKLLCLACALLMYFVVAISNYQSNPNIYSNSTKKNQKKNRISDQNNNLENQNPYKSFYSNEFQKQYQNNNLENIDYQILKTKQMSIYSYLKNLTNQLTPSKDYRNISSVQKFKQISFCIITSNTFPQIIFKSLQFQDYTNYKFIYRSQYPLIDNQKAFYIKIDNDLLPVKDQIINFYCGTPSIILLVKEPLKQNSLIELNQLYQRKNVWLTYDVLSDDKIIVSSFIGSVFLNLRKNDPTKIKADILSKNINFIILSLLQLTKYHCQSYSSQKISVIESFQLTTRLQPILFKPIISHRPYQSLFSLSQNYKIDQQYNLLNYKQLQENQLTRFQRSNISKQQMLQAIQYLQLKNLHQNHSLFQRQRIYYQTKYHLSKFPQQSFCIVIPSYNNIERDRYRKVLETVIYQNYNKYRIVFIDDFSTDKTLSMSRKFLADKGFDMKKVSFVRNKQKKYPTYNIMHAGQDYCQKRQVMMLLDGDDELVGRYVLKFLNYQYHIRDNWVVYTNYLSSDYAYGISQKVDESFFGQKRQLKQYFGPIMSFYVDLFRQINQRDLKDQNGFYVDADLKLTLQYPLFQMAGINHTEYVPEICYYYNIYQGDVDSQKSENEQKFKDNLISRNRYEKIIYLYDR